jgi:hypothetical protein
VLKVALIPPHLNIGFSLFFTKWYLSYFSRWVVLVRHFLLLKGVSVQDSFVEKAPYVRSIVKYVGKICYTWKLIVLFYLLLFKLVYGCGSIIWSTVVCGLVPCVFLGWVQISHALFEA